MSAVQIVLQGKRVTDSAVPVEQTCLYLSNCFQVPIRGRVLVQEKIRSHRCLSLSYVGKVGQKRELDKMLANSSGGNEMENEDLMSS